MPIGQQMNAPPIDFQPPFLSMGSSWAQGFLEAGMLALLPLYLGSLGMADGDTGLLLGCILAGTIICQLPVAWLADRFGRERILVACFVIVAVGLIAIPACNRGGSLSAWLLVVGICSGAFYPLGLALLGERLPAAEIPRANAWYLSVNCCGSLVSPLICGPIMAEWGRSSMFYTGAVIVVAILGIWCAGAFRQARQRRGANALSQVLGNGRGVLAGRR
jgi:MFS family permease